MCGISGYIGKHAPNIEEIQNTLSLMKNRGPDFSQYTFPVKEEQLSILFLHSRLSIIDLNPRSHQPFTIGTHTIIFNGEIYNYIEVRDSLEKRGVTFTTHSDTEVLLQAFIHDGPECLHRLEGMWSFAIWDQGSDTLYLSRDRFGEKPLYYTECQHGLYFGSEIKFLKSLSTLPLSANYQQVLRYLTLGYKSLYTAEDTFFHDVLEIPKASIVAIKMNSDGRLQKQASRYWKPQVSNSGLSRKEAVAGAKHHLLESLKIRLRSDVPLAFCLSGGVDSATLVSIASKIFNYDVESFSIIEDDPRYDERENIAATIRDTGCKSNLISIPKEGNLERLKNLIRYHDAPVATTTYFVHSLLSEKISQSGCKVAFSGTGADEIFTGYYDHFLLHLYELQGSEYFQPAFDAWKENVLPVVRNPLLQQHDLYIKDPTFRAHVYDNSEEFLSWLKGDAGDRFDSRFRETRYCDSLLKNRMLNELFHEITPLILHEDDLNSMRYSIENRSPYLDSRLVDFLFSLPAEHYINDGYGKSLLRESMEGILNDQVRLDRQKKGFNASIHSLIDFNSASLRDEVLDSGNTIFDIIDREEVVSLFSEEYLPNHYSKFLFSFINSLFFLDENGL